MRPVVLAMPGNETMASAIAGRLEGNLIPLQSHSFPDGETYLRIDGDVKDRPLIVVQSLAHPDAKFLPLIFAADAARDLGAISVGLVAPYLAYMRQDHRFNSGEAVTSRTVARLLSSSFDWLVSVDPHLHRYKSLSDIYSIPSRALHAAPLIADWIFANIQNPILIGPDSESAQWVGDVAARVGVPFTVLDKIRHGDRDVEVRLRDPLVAQERTPVLVDDIVSSGQTMLAAVRLLKRQSPSPPFCIAVHGLFADRSDVFLQNEGARLVTTNTVTHSSNAMDVGPMLASSAAQMLETEA